MVLNLVLLSVPLSVPLSVLLSVLYVVLHVAQCAPFASTAGALRGPTSKGPARAFDARLVCPRYILFVMRDPGELVPLLIACSAFVLVSVVLVKSAFFTK